MNHVNVSVTVDLRVDAAVARFEDFLREYAPETEMTSTLRAPFDLPAVNVGFTLHRDVTARITPPRSGRSCVCHILAAHRARPISFTQRHGLLRHKRNGRGSVDLTITLDGHYHPSFGLAGEMFDALVGKHIAEASALDLLDRIATNLGDLSEPASDFVPVTRFVPVSEFA